MTENSEMVVVGEILRRHFVWVLLEAGLDPEQLPETHALYDSIQCDGAAGALLRFQSTEEEAVAVAAIKLAGGGGPKLVRIEATCGSEALAKRLAGLFGAYAGSQDGESYRDQHRIDDEDSLAWRAPERALIAAGCPPIPCDRRTRKLDSVAAAVLMNVYETSVAFRARERVLFLLQAPKTGNQVKDLLGRWLIDQFPRFENRRHRDQIGCALLDLVCPGHVDALARLIANESLGASRSVLCSVVGKTRTLSGAQVLATQLGGSLAAPALNGLAVLGPRAAGEASAVRAILSDSRPAVRRLAKRALQRMGLAVEPSPSISHLISGESSPPAQYVEWSVNLDIDDLADALGVVGSVTQGGFGTAGAAEIASVVEAMRVDEIRRFKFPVQFRGEPYEIWLSVFLDDNDSPDLWLAAHPDLVLEVETAWRKSRFPSP